jgi:DNA mismatch repair protein MutL
MGKVIVLPPEIYNRIAAGEVIENPASVVKELIENSLDAGATEIEIKIKEAGTKEITVIDNGEGMTEEDALLAIKKHTTSKIKSIDDLNNIKSYGFRGEALSSIVSVSITEIITKTKEIELGLKLFIEDSGKKISKSYVASKDGTTIKVLNLFYNTPARKKFLKGKTTEIRYIKETVTSIALAQPKVKFTLNIDNQNEFNFYQKENFFERIIEVFGEELRDNLIYFENLSDYFQVRGYVSKPNFNRPTRNFQYLFLNQRPITAKYFNFWISEAYKELLPTGRFPYAFVYIIASPQFVDVNVHPAKKEVRFLNEFYIGEKIISGIRNALTSENIIPAVNLPSSEQIKNEDLKENIQQAINYFVSKKENEKEIEKSFYQEKELEKPMPIKENFFTLFNTYIFYEKDDNEVLVIDQHAAHERVIYERLKRDIENKKEIIQNLLIPLNITLSPSEMNLLKENKELLNEIGFLFGEFGQNTIAIYGVPSYIRHIDDRQLFLDIIAILAEEKKVDRLKVREKILKSMACKSAIKAGDYLSKEQKEFLIKDLLENEGEYTCPHGRPAVVKLFKKEIEKWFQRT